MLHLWDDCAEQAPNQGVGFHKREWLWRKVGVAPQLKKDDLQFKPTNMAVRGLLKWVVEVGVGASVNSFDDIPPPLRQASSSLPGGDVGRDRHVRTLFLNLNWSL